MKNNILHKYLPLLPAAAVVTAVTMLAALLSGCGGASADLPDLSSMGELVVVSREEGSGTRAEFENLTGTSALGTDMLASSTDEMIEAVASDVDAIGYIAYSSAAGSDEVKVITVGGVEASSTTISNDKYPLCRNYYLAYQDGLSDVATDFLRYVETAGQDIVAESCIQVHDSSTFLSDKSSGTITIVGSSSLAPIMEELAAAYMENENPNAVISVETTDSSDGLTAAIKGECDFAMSSRELESYEDELLEKSAIGRDAISIIVNAENPVTDLTVKMIKGIYDKTWESWAEIG